MTKDDIRLIKYVSGVGKRYGHWVQLMDLRPDNQRLGKSGRRNFIKFLETLYGPIGDRWHYQKWCGGYYVILKFNEEQDLLFFLLRFKSVNS